MSTTEEKQIVDDTTKALEPHQLRVVAEREELDKKISDLGMFIRSHTFTTIPRAEREHLKCQLYYMSGYSRVLLDRIEAFGEV